jgi:[ribosomal protein S5]-alanine N-acetyltransferase
VIKSLANLSKKISMQFEFEGIKIIALGLEQLVEVLEFPKKLLKSLQLPPQEVWNEEILIDISYKTILPNIQKEPENWLFFTRWLAIETQNNLIVSDFMLKYGLDHDGCIEIGYGTNPKFEKQGYMTKTIACFVEWAKTDRRIKIITAETEEDNFASMRVLEKNNFSVYTKKGNFVYWELVI